ncbi:pentatricopeptide repeat-containing protein At3g29230-like [Phalaenopsis equestris]|uniref:pentatricopeptide repeat-containing protein At3g29230-like n=1 Tax=Phalaenopsis equestris TaxID=78828 RepID=UPI0009E2D4C3|nr:pentatricopeptide repeat-containing protein At3g29230-like [Phalaenopsis equestris]
MSGHLHASQFTSPRRLLDHHLSDLHKCSDRHRLLQLHSQIFRLHLHTNPYIASKLIASYSLCLLPSSSAAVFNLVTEPTSHLFNTLIRAFAQNSLPSHSFATFFRMQLSSIKADSFTYPFLLKSFSGSLRTIELIHAHIIKLGFLSDTFVPNSLIDSYSKAGEAGSAGKVFDEMSVKNLVSWNSMLAALARAGDVWGARRLFNEMPDKDNVSWNSMLDGYIKAGEMDAAFDLFCRMPARNVVSWSTVVSGYCNEGDMEMASMMFDKMPVKNVVPWTIMISSYAEKGLAKEASALLDQMEEAGLELDSGAAVSILAACARSKFLELGKRIHDTARRKKMTFTTQISNALIDMYSKCGDLDVAWNIFEEMEEKDLVSWNSMLHGLALHGHGKKSLELFARMEEEGIIPDGFTFVGVLCACTHLGLIKEARRYFSSLQKDYGIVPRIEHYGCLIDILGRGGLLMEAYSLAKSMPLEPNAVIWGSILNACRFHDNVGIAEKITDELLSLELSEEGNFEVISNIYAAAGRWDGIAEARLKLKDFNRHKVVGSRRIKINEAVQELALEEGIHPQADRILRMLNRLGKHLKKLGLIGKGDTSMAFVSSH